MRSLWEVIDLHLDETVGQPGLTYGTPGFDARQGHGYGAVPGGKFSMKGGAPVNVANQANSRYPYTDADPYGEDTEEEEEVDVLDDPERIAAFLTKIGKPAYKTDPSTTTHRDKRKFVGADFGSVQEGPGRSAPYPKMAKMTAPQDVDGGIYKKDRGPVVGGTAPFIGHQYAGPRTIGSKAGFTGPPPVRFDFDDFAVYRLQDMPADDYRAVMRAAQLPTDMGKKRGNV